MPTIHPSAVLEGDIQLADNVVVGPGCTLTGSITLGAGCRLIAGAHLKGPLVMGEKNVLYPGACLGFAPQDLGWGPDRPGTGLKVGDGNVFREHVTIHRATSEERPTLIGNRNFFMGSSHAGHDCRIADDCIFANGTLLAGHVQVDSRVVTGGHVTIHQFCRMGRGSMCAGLVGMNKDLAPFFMLTGINIVGSMNLIGMRRGGLSSDEIRAVKWIFRTLYREGLTTAQACDVLRERGDEPLVAEYLEFVESSDRGLTPGKGKPQRGTA